MYSPVQYTGKDSCLPVEPVELMPQDSLKKLHQSWIEEMRQSPLEALVLCQRLSQHFDALITALATELLAQAPAGMSVIALGGYGREELYPYSDIDLLILLDGQKGCNPEAIKASIQPLLYPLWDLGLSVGHSIQTLKSSMALAKSDHTFATALLEARLICGDSQLYAQFQQTRKRLFTKRFVSAFMHTKYSEQKHRHATTRGMLEPNLKDGALGLRDLQTIRWCSQALCGIPDPVQAGLLSTFAFHRFRRCYRVLAAIRLQLHLQPNGGDNRLLMHHQMPIAEDMAFRQHKHLRPIERLMKRLFLAQSDCMLLSEIAEKRLSALAILPRQTFLEQTGSFKTPEDVLKFLLSALQQSLPLCAETLEKLWAARKLFVGYRPDNPKAESARLVLRRILCTPTDPEKFMVSAHLINQLGLLGAMLPDFQHIRGLTQLDGYHVWSVDCHTLRVMRNLHGQGFGEDSLSDPAPAPETIDQVLLFAALLHDIAKGRGGEHALKGSAIATEIAPKFGFNAQETAQIAWLVRQHLLLSDLALHRDILDSGTADALQDATPDAEHLSKLYALTIADVQAVAPNSWTTWKASVISRLYRHGQERLQPTSTPDTTQTNSAIQALRAALPNMSDSDFASHAHLCSKEYLLSTTLAVQIEHARMLTSLSEPEAGKAHIRLLPDTKNAIVRLILYTQDYSGLIGHTVGTLTEAGYSIATLKTFPYGDHCALMTVWFHHQGKAFFEEARLQRLQKRLSNTIKQRYIDFDSQTTQQQPDHSTSKVAFDNVVSKRSTVIEVRTHNRRGLLFDLTMALNENKLKIHAAKIDTFGNRAMDVFYVRNRFGLKIEAQKHLDKIRASIMSRISNTD